MRIKKIGKAVFVFCLTTILVCGLAMPAMAYFDRGPVSVSLGQKSVTLKEGESVNISVKLSPSSSEQLPGCGMPECPQSCGEKECLDANGECTCAGTEYQTYYATADVSSSNTSVATASYSSGNLHVKGIGSGTATITVTAMLRQFTSETTTLTVTVQKKETSSSNQSSGETASESQKDTIEKETDSKKTETSGSTSKKTQTSSDKKTTEKKSADKKNAGTTETIAPVEVQDISTEQSVGTVEVGTENVEPEKTDETGMAQDSVQNIQEGTQKEVIRSVESEKGTIYFEEISDMPMGK